MFRLYKEGQGTWARGILAAVVGLSGIMACMSLYEWMQELAFAQTPMLTIPFFNWAIKWDVILTGICIVPFGVVGVWLYNHRNLSDFLIETEGELKTKVTWPTRKEAMNNSVVVVITTVLLGLWVFAADLVLRFVSNFVYGVENAV